MYVTTIRIMLKGEICNMNILILCPTGTQSWDIAVKLQQLANKMHKPLSIKSAAFLNLEEDLNQVDVILVSPQLRSQILQIRKMAEPYHILTDIINPCYYQRMNIPKMMEQLCILINCSTWGEKELLYQ